MKRLTIVISAILLLFAGLVFFVNNTSNQSTSNSTKVLEVVEQKPLTLSAEIKSVNGQLIDVREPAEYEENHADNAINVPLGDIQNGVFSKIDKTKPIYVYCRSGVRAGKAKVALEAAGYKNVTSLGGLSDWVAKDGLTCSSTKPSCS